MKSLNALYQFDGTAWKVKEDSRLVVVTPADYDAMGSPGSHDNFSTSDAPENYPVSYTHSDAADE